MAKFSVFSFLVLVALLIFHSTSDRVIKNRVGEPQEFQSNVEDTQNSQLAGAEKTNSPAKADHANTNLEKYDEWCQARDYTDLSNHEIFKKFDRWIAEYEKLNCLNETNCTIHDPRLVAQIHQQGRKLARERKEIFLKIIRGDPAKAISMAIQPNHKNTLPGIVKEHVESWHSEKVDFQAMHVCFDKNHPEGLIKRFAVLSNGMKVRVWTYGDGSKLKTVNGLGVWGVSMDGDFALADKSYREITSKDDKPAIEFAGKTYSYSSDIEKELFVEELHTAERRASFISRRISYPIMAGSSSISDYYDRKYDIILNPMTWHDANNTAFARNGRLVIIESQKEQEFIHKEYQKAGVNGFDSDGNSINLAWIGATDSEDQNGTNFDRETNSSSFVEINATEGNWAGWMAKI